MEKTLVPYQIVPLFRGGTFHEDYNTKYSPFSFIPPKGTERIKLVAVITGHGSDNNNCAEFCATSHHFVVNKKHNYTRVFSNAGTAMGCADRVPEGVVPNEHGTWLYGRDGWCDGQEVVPWVVDITSALQSPNNTIEYFGWFNNTDPHPTWDPGKIVMYSCLTYYKYLTPWSEKTTSCSNKVHNTLDLINFFYFTPRIWKLLDCKSIVFFALVCANARSSSERSGESVK